MDHFQHLLEYQHQLLLNKLGGNEEELDKYRHEIGFSNVTVGLHDLFSKLTANDNIGLL